MDEILSLAKDHNIAVVEDAAHAPHSFYKGRPLGSLGVLSTFSFHETKNLSCGEGGLLAINSNELYDRAEILWEKGTNRAAFWRGKVSKYNWVDLGSSFLGSELNAAFLWAQLERLKTIHEKRVGIWHDYNSRLRDFCSTLGVGTPIIPDYATVNGHLYYLVTRSKKERSDLIDHLKTRDIHAVFHYLPLNLSPFAEGRYRPCDTPHATRYAECLVRLPLYYELEKQHVERVCSAIKEFYQPHNQGR
jgi:dTDP-4-amino-4,6-dideoxygalactose transaminase